MKEEVLNLAQKLYFDLPFWKRWKVRKYYISNNWDVTGEWQKCVDIAVRMVENTYSRIGNRFEDKTQ